MIIDKKRALAFLALVAVALAGVTAVANNSAAHLSAAPGQSDLLAPDINSFD